MVALKRHYEYWFVTVALHKIGAVLIPMTHMLTQEDILYRLRCAPVQAIVCTPQDQVPARVAGAVAQAGGACKLWTVQQDIPGFSNLTRAMEEAEDTLDRLPTLATDPMIMYFTSGTTGQPKGVVHDLPILWPILSRPSTGSRPRTAGSTLPWRRPGKKASWERSIWPVAHRGAR